MGYKKPFISFYFPTQRIGGAQLLFARIAKHLSFAGFKIKVYENQGNFISDYLDKNYIPYQRVDAKNSGKYEVTHSELFILPLSYVYEISQYFHFKNENKFIFWDLHHYSLAGLTSFSGIYKKIKCPIVKKVILLIFESSRKNKIEKFISLGVHSSGLFIMSQYNLNYHQEIFKFTKNPILLPIPIELPELKLINKQVKKIDRIRLGWISRLDKDKINILELLLEDYRRIQENYPDIEFELHVIGDGLAESYLKKNVEKRNIENIVFTGRLDSEKLYSYLQSKVDIGFSVGTSILEFAINGIPSVLMPFKTETTQFKTESKRYLWLHCDKGYNLGISKKLSENYLCIDTILSDYLNNPKEVGVKSQHHAKNNHEIEDVVKTLVNLIKNSSFTFSKIKSTGMGEDGFIEKFYFHLKKIYKNL